MQLSGYLSSPGSKPLCSKGEQHVWPHSAPVKSWDLLQSQAAQELNNLEKSSARMLAQHLPKICSGTEKRLLQ